MHSNKNSFNFSNSSILKTAANIKAPVKQETLSSNLTPAPKPAHFTRSRGTGKKFMNIPASITILQCNIGGNPVSRLAHGETLEKHIRQHNPTVIALTETKRTRKDIPKISGYSLITHDPLRGSSGGIAIYFKVKYSRLNGPY